MVLVYHNITPPEYFIGVHKELVKLCFRGRRELTAYIDRCDLALGDSEYNRAGARGARLPRDRACSRSCPISPTSTPARIAAGDELQRRLDERDVRRPRDPEQEVRRRHPRVPRVSHSPQPALATAARRLVQRLRDATWRCCRRSSRRLGTPDVHFLGHVSNEELIALYDVADLFLCASEHEGFCVPIIEAFYKRVPVLAYAATAVPATMDGGGVLVRHQGSARMSRALMDAVARRPDVEEAVVQSQDAALSTARSTRTSTRRCCVTSNDTLRLRRGAAPEVAWDFWPQFEQFQRFEELRQFRPALFRGAAARIRTRALGPWASGSSHSNTRPGSANAEPRIPNPESRA